jgi:hypothetical protein
MVPSLSGVVCVQQFWLVLVQPSSTSAVRLIDDQRHSRQISDHTGNRTQMRASLPSLQRPFAPHRVKGRTMTAKATPGGATVAASVSSDAAAAAAAAEGGTRSWAPRHTPRCVLAEPPAGSAGAFISQFELQGSGRGPLAGLTLAVKDLFDVRRAIVLPALLERTCARLLLVRACPARSCLWVSFITPAPRLCTDCRAQDWLWQSHVAGDTRHGHRHGPTCRSAAGRRSVQCLAQLASCSSDACLRLRLPA